MEGHKDQQIKNLVSIIRRLLGLIVFMLFVIISLVIVMLFNPNTEHWFTKSDKEIADEAIRKESLKKWEADYELKQEAKSYWTPADVNAISDNSTKEQVLYGKELIAHTAKYLGPKGSVMQTTNGMNCQNCHLDAGTKAWGNNYGAVFSTYP